METDMDSKIKMELVHEGETNDYIVDDQNSVLISENIKMEAEEVDTEETSLEEAYSSITSKKKYTPKKKIRYQEELHVGTSTQSSGHVHNEGSKSVKTVKKCSKAKRQKLEPRAQCEQLQESGGKPGPSVKNSDSWNSDSSQDETDEEQQYQQYSRALCAAAGLSDEDDEDVKPTANASFMEEQSSSEEEVLPPSDPAEIMPQVRGGSRRGGGASRARGGRGIRSRGATATTDATVGGPPSAADATAAGPPTATVATTDATAPQTWTASRARSARGSRRSLIPGGKSEEAIRRALCDFGSDGSAEDSEEDVMSQGRGEAPFESVAQFREAAIHMREVEALAEENMDEEMDVGDDERSVMGNLSNNFTWSEDFSSFTGRKEIYLRSSGPTFTLSQDPTEVFLEIWDAKIMGLIVRETNDHARRMTDALASGGRPLGMLSSWVSINIAEMYRYFALMIYMSMCQRAKVEEYWDTGALEMPMIRQIMSRASYKLITRCLHFVDNEQLRSGTGYDRRIAKIRPILDHCNRKFSTLYVPSQHLSLDESLLLWKGRLSWRQCIRSKAARFGIKNYELCESSSGYLLQCKLYACKEQAMHQGPLHGFTNINAKVVLQLMDGYFDVGHILVMDNWYNQLLLTRYLKSRRTDVLGTLSRSRKHVPPAIKDLTQISLQRGEAVARHCGDIMLVAWKDVQLVTTMSSCHTHEMLPTRAGQSREKPAAAIEYNRYMGGVDSKDQMLSAYLFERKKGRKWYMKVFKKLINTSLLNAYILYCKNPVFRRYEHREFRFKVAEGLLERFPRQTLPPAVGQHSSHARLQPGDHFPVNIGPNNHRKDCKRCTILGKRQRTKTKCLACNVPLCVDECWIHYHKRSDLSQP